MSIESQISQVVTSYIAAMHAWETDAERRGGHGDGVAGDCGLSIIDRVERLEKMFNTGEAEALEAGRQRILSEHCTARERRSRGGWGTTPKHHPELERITKVQQLPESRAHVWTDYTDSQGFRTRRRYDLLLCDGVWLIDQHYVLCDGEAYPEIY